MKFTLRDVVRATGGQLVSGDPLRTYQSVSIDTRTLKPGDLFFAISGPRFNAHDFLVEAVRRGAAGLVIEKLDDRTAFPEDRQPDVIQVASSVTALQDLSRELRSRSQAVFVGITGTNGKTTTKDMLASILGRAGKTLATRGNLNNHLGLPLTLSRLEDDHRFAVLEMGASREGDIQLLAEIGRPQVGLITNIGKAHLEGLHSPEGVLKVKRALFDVLPKDGTAVINLDDPLLAALKDSLPCRTMTFSLNGPADVSCASVRREAPVEFVLRIRGEDCTVHLVLGGRFQIYNALAAAAAALAAGVSPVQIVAGLESFRATAMRMQISEHPSGAILVNDAYNANPSSVRASVESFCRGYKGRPLWLVLGDMRELGESSRQEHETLGRWLAGQPLQRVFLYGREVRFLDDAVKVSAPAGLRIERYRKKRLLLEELERSLAVKPAGRQGLPQERPAILFKGSRAMKMEDIINSLIPKTVAAFH